MEARIIELEKRVAFQEDTLEVLNQSLIEQSRQLARLAKKLDRLQERLLSEDYLCDPSEETPPPHY